MRCGEFEKCSFRKVMNATCGDARYGGNPGGAALRRLTGEYAEQVRELLTRCNPETTLVVDLTEVTFVDSAGEEVLSDFMQRRGEFIADNVYAKHLCERLQLPVVRSRRRKRDGKLLDSPKTPLSSCQSGGCDDAGDTHDTGGK